MFKHILALFLSFSLFSQIWAQSSYTYIIPTAPGTVSDLISRSIIDEYHRQTGNKLLLENMPGGDFIIGINRFKSCKSPCLIATGTSVQVTNFVTKENLPYSPEDFDHIGWIGWFPNILYVNANSDIRTLEDFKKHLENKKEITVAISDSVNALNVAAIHARYKNNDFFRMVNYKTSTQGLQDVIGGTVDMGMVAAGATIISAAESGRIRIIGSTHHSPITLGGQYVPPVGPAIKTEIFQSSQTLSMTPGAVGPEYDKLKSDLLSAIRSKAVAETLAMAYIIVDGGDGKTATQRLKNERARAAKFASPLSTQ